MQDGVATAVAAEAPASRNECFGVFCNIYDLKAVSPSASHHMVLRSPSQSLPVFVEMLHRLGFFCCLSGLL